MTTVAATRTTRQTRSRGAPAGPAKSPSPAKKKTPSKSKTAKKPSMVVTDEMVKEEQQLERERAHRQPAKEGKELHTTFSAEQEKQKVQRLKFLLEKTTLYSDFCASNIRHPDQLDTEDSTNGNGKRTKKASPSKKKKAAAAAAKTASKTLKGGTLRPYQVDGVAWLTSLYENGLNGILADEMGLGKTIQVIGFLSHLRDNGVLGPFIVVCPLSTLPNWLAEFQKWVPDMPSILYHGTKDEREELRRTHLGKHGVEFPVVLTSYEIAMIDRAHLVRHRWKYLVVDEGHRLKNFNCKLLRELKKYPTHNRLLLTGTPLQNNLSELWSLLNFLLPDIFDDLDQFQSWFDFEDVAEGEKAARIIAEEESKQIVTKLHRILQPFLLRRLKADVDLSIPAKRELVLYAPLTKLQQQYYRATLNGTLVKLLVDNAAKRGLPNPVKTGRVKTLNKLMQLRKACQHPYLFDEPVDENGQYVTTEALVEASGKLQLVDRMLKRLRAEGRKVLIFSQFTRVIDILQDFLIMRGLRSCRIVGDTPILERQAAIKEFTEDKDLFAFLLSTRAGGLGLNLVAADTVIIFDSDWNPQADLQAQDRCHRIGQKSAVMVYRIVAAHTIEAKILDAATAKRKLEALVMHKNKFKGRTQTKTAQVTASGMTAKDLEALLECESATTAWAEQEEKVISDSDLERVMNRELQLCDKQEKGAGFQFIQSAGKQFEDALF